MGKTKIKTIDDSAPEEGQVARVKSQVKKQKEVKKEAVPLVISNDLSENSQDEEAMDSGSRTSGMISVETQDEKNEIATSLTPRNDPSMTRVLSHNDNKKEAKKESSEKTTRSKKYLEAAEKVERTKNYSLNEAVEKAKGVSYSKFDGTIEIHMTTGQKNLRGLVTLPFSAGKKLRVLAFGNGAEDSGADKVGYEETLDEILKGKIDFDVLVTTPAWMPKLAKAARVLGPRGLMPNPKSGTITDNLKKAVTELQSGKTEYKNEKNAFAMHLSLGKVSQDTNEIAQNIKILIQTIGKTRVKKATLAPTMGPGVKLDLSSI